MSRPVPAAHPITRLRTINVRTLAFLLALCVTAPPRASATHVTVKPDGSGDYPTIEAAVDAMRYAYIADTLVIEPGRYDEVVNLYGFEAVLCGRAGAESTSVRELRSFPEQPYEYSGYGRAVGLTIEGKVAWGRNSLLMWWENCVFAKGYDGHTARGAGVPARRCTFRGPSSFVGFGYDLADCTFESAPAYFENEIGYLRIVGCTFRGPGAELARVRPRDQSDIVFDDCVFENAGDAIVVDPLNYWRQILGVRRCRFRNLGGSAIEYKMENWTDPVSGSLWVYTRDNLMTDVGQAVRLLAPVMISLSMDRDTIRATSGTAVEAAVRSSGISRLRLSDSGGDGLRLTIHNFATDPYAWGTHLRIEDCAIRGSAGNGLVIEQLDNPVWDPQEIIVARSLFELNRGAGVSVAAEAPTVRDCVLRGNGGDGLHVLPQTLAPAATLTGNTLVENGGHGLVVTSERIVSPLTLDHNLVSHNAQSGIAVLSPYIGTVSYNDSWANQHEAYKGLRPEEVNLQLDPLYCMASAGAFDLRADSPCAPSGIYGLIGARALGCAVPTRVESSRAATGDLRIAPNPARGAATFDWGGGARMDDLAIYDVQGRLRWRAPGSSLLSGALRWDGRDAAGRRLATGVYLVRWREGARSGSSRLVLLDD